MNFDQRLQDLRQQGGQGLVGPELQHLEFLLSHLSKTEGPLRQRLKQRLELRFHALERRFAEQQAKTDLRMQLFCRVGLEPSEEAENAQTKGDLALFLLETGRQLAQLQPRAAVAVQARLCRLAGQIEQRGITLPGRLARLVEELYSRRDAAGTAQLNQSGRDLNHSLADLLLSRSSSKTRASRALAQAKEHRPVVAGPYNADLLVSNMFEQLAAVAPDYLQQLVEYLDSLAALARLPDTALTADKPGAKGRKKKRAVDPRDLRKRPTR